MTVQTTNAFTATIADGVQTVFDFDFQTQESGWVQAFEIDLSENEIPRLDITVVINEDQEANPGGTCTFSVAPLVNFTAVVFRNAPQTQQTDYVPYDAFPAESTENALDKLTMLVQDAEFAAGGGGGGGEGPGPVFTTDVSVFKNDPAYFLNNDNGTISKFFLDGPQGSPAIAFSKDAGVSFDHIFSVTPSGAGEGEIQLYGPNDQQRINIKDVEIEVFRDLRIVDDNPAFFLDNDDGNIMRLGVDESGGGNAGIVVSSNNGVSFDNVLTRTMEGAGEGELQLYGPNGILKMNLEADDVAFFQSIRMEPGQDVNLGTTGSLNCSRPLGSAERNIRGNPQVGIAGARILGVDGTVLAGSYGILAVNHSDQGIYQIQLVPDEAADIELEDWGFAWDCSYGIFGPGSMLITPVTDGVSTVAVAFLLTNDIETGPQNPISFGITVFNTGRSAL